MNNNKVKQSAIFTVCTTVAAMCLLVACNQSSETPERSEPSAAPSSSSLTIGQGLPDPVSVIARSKDIPESEYLAYLFLRGCGDQAISDIGPYLEALSAFRLILVMTDDCGNERGHSQFLSDRFTSDQLVVQNYLNPEWTERYFIEGQTTLYVGKEDVISYIHKDGEPFPFTSKEELIAHIESQ